MLILSLCVYTAVAQNHQIAATVSDGEENPIEGLTISLKELSKSAMTSSDGSFTFTNLNEGNFTLLIRGTGFNYY